MKEKKEGRNKDAITAVVCGVEPHINLTAVRC